MTIYYVDDGGSNTSPYDTWAKAATSLKALDTAIAFASGDIIYIGHDHVDPETYSADYSCAGPSSGEPVSLISATQGSSPVTYQKATANQISMTGAYQITFDGSFYLKGLQISTADTIQASPDSNEVGVFDDCKFLPGTGSLGFFYNNGTYAQYKNCEISFSADAGDTNTYCLRNSGDGRFFGLTFSNCSTRTHVVTTNWGGLLHISGADFSGFTNATACELVNFNTGGLLTTISNSKTAATWTPFDTTRPGSEAWVTNTGPSAAPTYLAFRAYIGDVISSASIYRSGGATFGGASAAWLVTTESYAAESAAFFTPWIYGTIDSTGNKTFTIYTTNDTANFTDAEIWIEVQFLDVSGSGQWAFSSTKRVPTDSAVAYSADASTWNGTGPSFTYKQAITSDSLSVDQAGPFRARMAIGVASIASSRYFYIDPAVTVA